MGWISLAISANFDTFFLLCIKISITAKLAINLKNAAVIFKKGIKWGSEKFVLDLQFLMQEVHYLRWNTILFYHKIKNIMTKY